MDEWVRYLLFPLQICSDQLIVTDPSDLSFLLQMCKLDTLIGLDGWLDGWMGGWMHGCCILGAPQ